MCILISLEVEKATNLDTSIGINYNIDSIYLVVSAILLTGACIKPHTKKMYLHVYSTRVSKYHHLQVILYFLQCLQWIQRHYWKTKRWCSSEFSKVKENYLTVTSTYWCEKEIVHNRWKYRTFLVRKKTYL